MKKPMMLMLLFSSAVMMLSCGTSTNNPKSVAKDFFEALEKKDYDKAANYATKDSKAALDLVKSLSSMGEAFKSDSIVAEEKLPTVVYGDAVIEGDMATVPITVNGETNNVTLKKEDGAWKVAFDKNTLKQTAAEKSGKTVEEMNAGLNEAVKEMENINMDSLKEAMGKMQEVLESDSLKKALNDAGNVLNKMGDALKEASKEQ